MLFVDLILSPKTIRRHCAQQWQVFNIKLNITQLNDLYNAQFSVYVMIVK